MYALSYQADAVKDFGKLDRTNQELLKRSLERLCQDPTVGNIKRVQNVKPAIYRFRTGRIRVFFGMNKKQRTIRIMAIQLRRETSDTYDLQEMRRLASEMPDEFKE